MAPRSLVSSDRIGDFDKKKISRILLEKICEVLPGIRAQVRDCPVGMFGLDEKLCDFLTWKGPMCDRQCNEMWSVLLMEWMFFLKNSQVVAFRISFECFLVGFCFVSEKTSCWQPMVSPLDLFRFASVSWPHWFHFGIGNSQSPRSESRRGMCPTKHGWMAHDAAVVWCWNHINIEKRVFWKFQASQAAEWYQACFPVHPCGSGDVMSLTSGQCQAEWWFKFVKCISIGQENEINLQAGPLLLGIKWTYYNPYKWP